MVKSTDGSHYIIKAQDYNDVLEKFLILHNNQTGLIAKSLGLTYGYTGFIIDTYLNELEMIVNNKSLCDLH
jgi:hypothetical protein